MIGVILARIFFVALIIVAACYIVSKVYSNFIQEHLTEEEVEDILESAKHDRVIKEAHKVADKITNDSLEDNDDVKSQV